MKLSKRDSAKREPEDLIALEIAEVSVDLLPVWAALVEVGIQAHGWLWNEASSTVCGKGTTLVLAATSCLRAPWLESRSGPAW